MVMIYLIKRTDNDAILSVWSTEDLARSARYFYVSHAIQVYISEWQLNVTAQPVGSPKIILENRIDGK